MILIFSLKLFWRELKSGQLSLMVLALILAVTTVSSISFFTDRLQKALVVETQEFLGGDIKFDSNKELSKDILLKANSLNIEVSKMTLFASMISSQDSLQLSSIKAVDKSYPMVGHVELKTELGLIKKNIRSPPYEGFVWLDKRLIELLNIKIGDLVGIGNHNFRVSHILVSEPDRGSSGFAFAPKVIMNIEDLPKTNIIQPGSRVRYAYLFLGEKEKIKSLKLRIENIQQPGDRIIEVGSDQASIGNAVSKSKNFFLLGGLLAVLMSSFTIAISSQRFTRRHKNYVAILRTLGLSSFEIKLLYFLLFFELAVFAVFTGILIGWLIQEFFVLLLQDYFPTNLPFSGTDPIVVSSLTAFICLVGFTYPYITKLINISPINILRKEDDSISVSSTFFILMSLSSLFGLLLLYTESFLLSSVLFGTLIFTSLLGIASILALFYKKPSLGLGADNFVKLAWNELHRRKYSNSLQVLSFTAAIGLCLITFVVKTELISSWEANLPEDSPNNFVMNISNNDLSSINSFLIKNEIKLNPFFPIVNVRLIRKDSGKNKDNLNQKIDRTFNATWTYNLPTNNLITSGQWFNKSSKKGLSISEEIAERYSLSLGDPIKLVIASNSVDTSIQSIRKVDWESFRPNFFVIGHPSLFANIPSTFITSFYIPKSKEKVITSFMSKFKTVSVFSIEALIKQVSDIIEQVSKALEIILVLTIISAMFLMVASIHDGFNLRLHQAAVLRTLGADSSLLYKATGLEFAFLGFLAGILASVLAQISLYFLETRVFEINPTFHFIIWILGPLSGLMIISLLCILLITSITQKNPKEILLDS